MHRRWLVALALAAGCGSAGRAPDHDATADSTSDHVSASEGGNSAEARPEVGAVTPDAAAERGAEVGDASDAADLSDARADGPAEAPPADVLQAFCPSVIPVVTVASGPVMGVLAGASNNPFVSCHGGVVARGPEAYFTLKIDVAMTVQIVVASSIDTLIAIRPGVCTDGISELACGENPPPVDPDAGTDAIPFDAGGSATPPRLTGVRTPLAPGTYTIVVDSYTLGNLTSAPFTMTIAQLASRPNASCAAPTLLSSGTKVTAEPLDLAGAPKAVCAGGAQSALYYAVGVPSGQRVTVRAAATGGDQPWMPRLEAFTACSSSTCLAQGHLAAGATQQLDWTNNGANWQLIYLAVAADSPVAGATFDLTATITDLFATCSRPVVVTDGAHLVSQDLSVAAATTQACNAVPDHAFYYAATLLPQQQISVSITPTNGPSFSVAATVSIRDSCGSTQCASDGNSATFTNQASSDVTVLVEVTPQRSGVTGIFDLDVSIPLPPAGIVVTPTTGLVTTESGGTATFTVALTSPPSDDVTLGVASDTPTEGTASPATLTFTTDNWRTPQTVTVTGVDDQVADGAREYMIVTSAATSTDPRYTGLDADDVVATNLDNDPGVDLEGTGDVVTSESGMTSTFTARLNVAPTAPVTMALTSNDVGEGTVSPAQLTFTSANWSTPQTVTVTGVDDAVVDGAQAYTIVTGTLASTDARYAGQDPPDVLAHNLDDDQVAVATKLVSGDHTCGSTGAVPIAMDRGGTLYIVMSCEGGLWFVASADGGVTFSDPALITGTDVFNGTALLAGGAAGFVYLVFTTGDGHVAFLRTADGGTTWSTPVMLSDHADVVPRLAGGGKTVIVLTPGTDGTSMVLSRSVDGGRTFLPKRFLAGSDLDVAVEPGGRAAWLLDLQNTNDLRESTDAGATFLKIASLNQNVDPHLIGNQHLFVLPGGPMQVISLADPTTIQMSVDFINLPPLGMSVDEVDGLTILDTDPGNGHLRATHVVPGATTPTDGRMVGPSPGMAGVAALSRRATAIAALDGSILLYTTVVWP